MKPSPKRDYAESGLTIQYAMLDHVKRSPNKTARPPSIQWGGLPVATADWIPVPREGRVRGEFLSSKGAEQGFDIEVDGWVEIPCGQKVKLLRTWHHPSLPAFVEYPFRSENGQLWTWNIYKMRYPGGTVVEEKWTENAGFWIERVSETERIYHCSHGMANPPDFESLIFKLSITNNLGSRRQPQRRKKPEPGP